MNLPSLLSIHFTTFCPVYSRRFESEAMLVLMNWEINYLKGIQESIQEAFMIMVREVADTKVEACMSLEIHIHLWNLLQIKRVIQTRLIYLHLQVCCHSLRVGIWPSFLFPLHWQN